MSQMIRHLMLLFLALSLVAFQGQAEDAAPAARPAAPATAKDWPLFRGDPLSSGVAHTTLPDKPEQLLALFFVDQRVQQHHHDAHRRKDQFRQDADVIHALRNRL